MSYRGPKWEKYLVLRPKVVNRGVGQEWAKSGTACPTFSKNRDRTGKPFVCNTRSVPMS